MDMRAVRLNKKFVAVILLCAVVILILTLVSSNGCPGGRCHEAEAPYIVEYKHREWRNATVRRILRWTPFFKDHTWEGFTDRSFLTCKVSACSVTNDKSLLEQSDAVLFHATDFWNFFWGTPLPSHKPPFQVWVLMNMEPPTKMPLDFNKFKGVFNWTAWHRQDSDVPITYGGFTEKLKPDAGNVTRNWAREKANLIAWMASNCFDPNQRQVLVKELSKHMPVNTYGKCGTAKCADHVCSKVISTYKFYLSLENSNCRDYVTEKFWEALERGQVPVVYGGGNYQKIAPPHSYIDINDFRDLKSLATHLLNLDRNDQEYNKYLAWTQRYQVYGQFDARRQWWCNLCEALHDKKRPAQTYVDLESWATEDLSTCPRWTLGDQLGQFANGLKFKLGFR